MPNILGELFSQYGPDDYVDIFEEYRTGRSQRSKTLRTLALDTRTGERLVSTLLRLPTSLQRLKEAI